MLAFALALVSLFHTTAQYKPHPLCLAKSCPSTSKCRAVSQCSDTPSESCAVKLQCLNNPPESHHTAACLMGDPVLARRESRTLVDQHCHVDALCPRGTYCSALLTHVEAVCCLTDPDAPAKDGSCPFFPRESNNGSKPIGCTNHCNNDGDCRHKRKCCYNGCSKECMLPGQRNETCDKIRCPPNTYCQREGMPFCTGPSQCWSVGECVPCPRKCKPGCRSEKDYKGCPTRCDCNYCCWFIVLVQVVVSVVMFYLFH